MADVEGCMTYCDHQKCEEHCFRKTTGNKELDGGFTRLKTHEPYPEGWGWADGKILCPKHFRKWNELVHDFNEEE